MTPKQERFVQEYLIDPNATAAYKKAYGVSDQVANANGPRLLGNASIAAEIARAQQAASERTGITQDWVLTRLKENVERAMQAEPVKDSKGIPTGEYVYQGSVANGALQLLGKHLGMFGDKLTVNFEAIPQMTDEELEGERRKLRLVA